MTLPLNSRLSALYETDGVQKDFGFGFRVFYDPDNGGYGIEARIQTADGYDVIPKSEYIVMPIEDNTAGIVRFHIAPSAGQLIYLAGNTPTIQQLVLTNFGRFSAESIEGQFDFITAIIQEWISALSEEERQRIAGDEIVRSELIAQWAADNNEFKEYIENLVNALVGAEVTPLTDSKIKTWSGRTQVDENKDFVSSVHDYSDLDDIAAENGRTVVVKKEGIAGSFTYKSDSVKIHNGGTVIKDALNRVWERQYSGIICGSWFEPDPDGVTDNTDKFTAAAALGPVYLSGGNYKTDIIPFAQFFGDAQLTVKNGTVVETFKLTGSPSSFPDNILTYDDGTQELNTNLYIGLNSGRKSKGTEGMVTAVGHRTLEESGSSLTTDRAVRITAIGAHAIRRSKAPFSVVAVGDSAMEHGEFMSRMVAVGSNALQFSGCTNPTLYKHEFMIAADQYGLAARNSGWRSIVGAMGSPLGLAISNEDSKESVAVGRNAMLHNIATKRDVALGYNAMVHGWSTYDNVAIGNSALRDATVTYTTVAVGSQSCELLQQGAANVAIGFQSFSSAVHLESCTAIGTQALQKLSGNSTTAATARSNARQNTAIGAYAMQNTVSAVNMVAVGNASFQNISGNQSVAVGVQAGSTLTNAVNTTLIGHIAGTKTLGGSPTVSLTNSAALGYDAPLSGDNQVQLGNSATTTYVYGTVQNRSDARDKADIRNTELGLDFINSLRPVDYKWDMREDYIKVNEDGSTTQLDKDGSKKRNRYHHGFIAQEVPQEFGGYQDHKVQGGADVLSLGYDEFIAPLVKSVQELTQRVAELEAEKQK